MHSKNKENRITLILPILLLAVLALAVLLGSVNLSFADFVEAVKNTNPLKHSILFSIRIPRVLGGAAAGIGLAVSGAIIQTVFNNSLASPNIIGVNAGASFFVVLAGAFLPLGIFSLPVSAFLGAFFSVMFIFLFGKKTGFSKTSLILLGLAVNSLFTSATDFLCNLNDSFIVANKSFRMGSLNGINTNVMLVSAVLILISVILALFLHNELEVLSLGEESASVLGLNVKKYRIVFLTLSAILAGSAISFSGPIGFVGLIVPHIVRLSGVRSTRKYIFCCAVSGAALVVICDLIGRTLFSPHEMPVGIILSVLGVPFFIWLLVRGKGRAKNA